MKLQNTPNTEKVYALFEEYRRAYAAEWERLKRCERMYLGDHWHDVPPQEQNEPRPVTPIIQSTIESVRADLMDQMPEAIITADDPEYEHVAETLSAVVRENHMNCGFEREYARMTHDLLVGGTMVMEIGYDPEANASLGGAFIRAVEIENILFDPWCADIQDSRAVFKVTPHTREWFASRYPEDAPHMEADAGRMRWREDPLLRAQTDDCILLIECWQREFDPDTGDFRVHMQKLAGRRLLEDSRAIKPEGYFAHGRYPFVVTPLFPRKGCALGYGFVDMFETQQRLSDKLDQIVLKNALMASRNKLLVTGASGFDVDDLKDWAKEVHKGENLNGVTWFATAPLPPYIISYIREIREGIKEESGANDFSRGAANGGVTAASAIAALQEMSSKRSRMAAKAVHGAFAEAVRQEIEIEREFSVFGRPVVLRGVGGAKKARLLPELLYRETELRNKVPLDFFVSVKVQRENKASVAAANELVFRLVQTGMVTPQIGLELLMFDGKAQTGAMPGAVAPRA